MTDQPIREPVEIRRDCARKLRSVTIPTYQALFGFLLAEDWSTPRIEQIRITPNRCLLARVEGDSAFRMFLGEEADLIQSVHGIARLAELDGDEVGFLLGRIAEIKGMG
jgi:hypothetical protein